MSSNKYLKPMLDTGSPRVFNCNVLSKKISALAPDAPLFFRNKPLNTLLLIKDTAPSTNPTAPPVVGTKLYFPFNVGDIYEGGRTIFISDPTVEKAIIEQYGEGALKKDLLEQDMQVMRLLDGLPSLDPFLMKDALQRQRIEANKDYFVVNQELWNEIEAFMLLRFEPLVKAAFPDAMSSDEKAKQLINTIWEARDLQALQPLILGFRLPQNEALDIFASWKGIVYYSYQYTKEQQAVQDFLAWLKSCETSTTGMPASESKAVMASLRAVAANVANEWRASETIVKQYEDAYDKAFKHKTSSTEFLTFLRSSNKTYWIIGNSLGKISQAIYCWRVMTSRFAGKKIPWEQLQAVMQVLVSIFPPEKKAASAVSW